MLVQEIKYIITSLILSVGIIKLSDDHPNDDDLISFSHREEKNHSITATPQRQPSNN